MTPWIRNLLFGGGGGGGPVLPPTGRTLLANLTSSLILDEGTGAPTWSRPSAAWRFNELGLFIDVPSECATFVGARLVRNLVPTPSNTLAISGTKTVTMTRSATLQFSMGAGAGTATFSGTGGATGTLVAGAGRVYVNKTVTAGTFIVTASVGALADLQIVDVTGYDASYVPAYISVGVVSSPFFGAGVDGAKYFETDWQGAPIPAANKKGVRLEGAATNNILHCRDFTNKVWQTSSTSGAERLSNGTFDANITGWADLNFATSSWDAGRISVISAAAASGAYATFASVVGKSYTVSAGIVSATGYSANTVLRAGAGSIPDSGIVDSSAYGAPGTKTISFTATSTTSFVYLRSSSSYTTVWDNVTVKESGIQPAKNVTGIDGIANTASSLTWTTADAVFKQSITMASAARCTSVHLKRGATFVGPFSISQDDGSNWTDVTAQINNSTFTRVVITSTLANPVVCLKSGTVGDIVIVDCVQNEGGTVATSEIVTTTAAVTRSTSTLSYQTASNWSDTAGAALITVEPYVWSTGGLVGSATNGLLESASNSGATASDGTNTANGPTGTPTGRKKLAMKWGGGAMTVASGGVLGTPGTYDGAMGLSSIGIGISSPGYFGSVAIYDYAMTDAELQAITT